MLKLDSAVMDVEFAEQLIYPLKDGIAFRWRHVFDQHMATQRMGVRSEAPDMNIMDFDYRIEAHTSLSSNPRGRPSSSTFRDSWMMSQAVQMISTPINTDSTGSIISSPVK